MYFWCLAVMPSRLTLRPNDGLLQVFHFKNRLPPSIAASVPSTIRSATEVIPNPKPSLHTRNLRITLSRLHIRFLKLSAIVRMTSVPCLAIRSQAARNRRAQRVFGLVWLSRSVHGADICVKDRLV